MYSIRLFLTILLLSALTACSPAKPSAPTINTGTTGRLSLQNELTIAVAYIQSINGMPIAAFKNADDDVIYLPQGRVSLAANFGFLGKSKNDSSERNVELAFDAKQGARYSLDITPDNLQNPKNFYLQVNMLKPQFLGTSEELQASVLVWQR